MSQPKTVVIETARRSFPVMGLLGAALVILKALGMIGLEWKWVLAPFWIGPAVVLGVFATIGLAAAAAGIFLAVMYAVNWLYAKVTK